MDKDLYERLGGCKTLPTLPIVASRLVELSANDDFGLADVAEIIRSDMAIVAKVIATANTVAYRRGEASTDIEHAVSRLGINATMMIALAFSLSVRPESEPDAGVDTQALWRRSIVAAGVARLLAKDAGSTSSETVFLASLVQDIGVLALLHAFPNLYENLDSGTHSDAIPCEVASIGVDHSVVGQWLLSHWSLPGAVADLVASSHEIAELAITSGRGSDAWCVAISGLLADALLAEEQLDAARLLSITERVCGFSEAADTDLVQRLAQAVSETETLFETELIEDPVGLLETSKSALLERMTNGLAPSKQQKIVDLEDRVTCLEEQGRLDSLTGVPNRMYFHTKLEQAFTDATAHRRPLSLLFIDVDFFKRINDTFGHLVGDKALKRLSKTLENAVGKSGTVGRYGGEEFVALLPDTDPADALSLGRSICDAVSQQATVIEERLVRLTVSIGVAGTADASDLSSAKTLLVNADEAMYLAKRCGRNQCIGAVSFSS